MSDYKLKYIKKSILEYRAVIYNQNRETSVDSRDYRQLKHLLSSIYDVQIPSKSELKRYGKNNVYEYYLPKGSDLFMGKAEYHISRNDMFWEIHFLDIVTSEFVKLTWMGYNDNFWWENVAPTEQARVRKGVNGKSYRIDFNTNEVWEIQNDG